MPISSTIIRRTTVLVSIGLLVASLTQKCYCTTDVCGDSLAVFLIGAIGFITGGAALCWLANPVLLASWLFAKSKPNVSLTLATMALMIALSFLLFDSILDDEGGHYKKIVSYQAGYWLWCTSSMAMIAGSLFLKYKHVRRS